MNKISEIFNKIPQWELSKGCLEIIEDNNLGLIRPNGVVKKYVKIIATETNGTLQGDFQMTAYNILKEFAKRQLINQ